MSPVEMSQTFLLLLFDLGLLALLVQAYAFLNGPRQKSGSELSASGQSNLVPNIILGASCGAMASLTMLNPIPLPLGAVMDPRAGPIMIAGLFAGPWGAAIAAIIGGATRAFVIGGPVAFAGAVSFALYGAAGLIAASFIKRRGLGITPSVLIGVGVFSSVAVLPSFFIGIPLDQSWSILKSAMPILVPTNIISVLIVGFALELQRRRLEALESNLQLLDENTKLSFVADKTTNGVIITDRDGRIEWVNAGFTRITGYTLDECIGRKPGAFLQGPDTDPDTVNEISDKLFRRQDCNVGIQNYHKDGSKIWLNLEIHPVIQDGDLRNFVAVETDETERRRYESELLEAKAEAEDRRLQIENILEAAPDAILVLEQDGRILSTNPAAQAIFQRPIGTIEGMELGELIPDLTTETGELNLQTLLNGGRLRPVNGNAHALQALTPNGRLPINMTLSRFAAAGRPMFIAIIREMSLLENQRLELQRANQLLDTQLHELEIANRSKSEFLATVSHELRTPLNAILGYSELMLLMKADAASGKTTEYCRSIHEAGRVLLHHISGVLDAARMDTGRVDLRLQTTSVREAIEASIRLLHADTTETGTRIMLEEGEDTLVWADTAALRQVMTNIMGNAIKFSPDGSSVHVTIEPGAESTVIKVQDEGPSIPQDHLHEVLKPFVRHRDPAIAAETPGTGLGLAITRGLVDGMGGTLTLENKTDGGLAVSVTLSVSPRTKTKEYG